MTAEPVPADRAAVLFDGNGTVVLFDWNGTVVLDAERARSSLNRVLEDRELAGLDAEAFRREFHLPMAAMFARLGVREVTAAEHEWNRAMMSASTTARDGLASIRMLAASGVRIGVVSAASEPAVRADMSALGVDDLWQSVDAPVADKLAVLRARRGGEERAFYVGDTEYDMRCARDAGYLAIGVDRGYAHPEALSAAGALAVITSFRELPVLLREAAPQR